VVYNYYRDQLAIAKIAGMLETAFDSHPIIRLYDAHKAIFAVGPMIQALDGNPPPGDGSMSCPIRAPAPN
jgi:hypothetical protein